MDIFKRFAQLTSCLKVFVYAIPDEATNFLVCCHFEWQGEWRVLNR